MSLLTDTIFVKALQADTELLAMLPAHDVYNTSIALPDRDLDNAPLPYVIVTFDGLVNDQSTKDSWEGDTDSVQVGIEVAAKTRSQLGQLAERIRHDVRTFFSSVADGDDLEASVPYDYQFTASDVYYDSWKPCYWQVLRYQCDVRNDED